MKKPTKPQRGQKALQSIYNSVCEIIDYLPSLEVTGDNKTISVSHSLYGTTIHAIQQQIITTRTIKEGGQGGEEYYAGSGITISPTNVIAIIPPPNNTKNYALVCLSGQMQWVELGTCE